MLLDVVANASAKDNCGRTPLHQLLANYSHHGSEGYLGFVRQLLEHGVDVNAEDEEHATALHWAFDHRGLEVAPVLLDHGANPNAENNLGEIPLHRLLKQNYFREVRVLGTVQLSLEHGAQPNGQDKDGVTPLQLTSRNGMLEGARLLRNQGTKNAKENDQGRTPLHTAYFNSKIIPVLRS